jgi:hypothetical protein
MQPPLWQRPIEETMPDLARAMAEGRPPDSDQRAAELAAQLAEAMAIGRPTVAAATAA